MKMMKSKDDMDATFEVLHEAIVNDPAYQAHVDDVWRSFGLEGALHRCQKGNRRDCQRPKQECEIFCDDTLSSAEKTAKFRELRARKANVRMRAHRAKAKTSGKVIVMPSLS